MNGGAISWASKRQPTVALSTTESEYMALSSALQEAIWLRQLNYELNIDRNGNIAQIYCDNRSAIDLSASTGYRGRTKHIDIRHHFIKEKVRDGIVEIKHIGTEKMVADVLTKALFGTKHLWCCKKMGLTDAQ